MSGRPRVLGAFQSRQVARRSPAASEPGTPDAARLVRLRAAPREHGQLRPTAIPAVCNRPDAHYGRATRMPPDDPRARARDLLGRVIGATWSSSSLLPPPHQGPDHRRAPTLSTVPARETRSSVTLRRPCRPCLPQRLTIDPQLTRSLASSSDISPGPPGSNGLSEPVRRRARRCYVTPIRPSRRISGRPARPVELSNGSTNGSIIP